MWDVIVLIPDNCLSIYFRYVQTINVWSRMPQKPGHELYKQIVELAVFEVQV